MTNLPLNISNVPAKSAAGKPSCNDDVAQQDAQGFGNLLARQVADAAKPAEPVKPSSGDAVEQVKTETAAADSAKSLPADMLAALLAQQNPTVTPQPEVNIHPIVNAEITAFTSATSDKKADASPALISGNFSTGNTAAAVLDTASPKDESAAKDSVAELVTEIVEEPLR